MSKSLYSKISLYAFILVCLFSESFSFILDETEPPVLRLALNGSNLGDIEKIVISKLLKERDFPIQPFNITEDIQILGKISFDLDNIILKITNSTDAEIYLQFAEDKNLNFVLNLLNGEVTFDYNFTSGLMASSGNSTVYLNNISLSLNNTIIQVQNEYEPEKFGPGLQIDSIVFNDFDFEFIFSKNGTFEKFIKYFNKNLKTVLLKIIENELNSESILSSINNYLNDTVKKLRLNVQINDILQIEQSLNISYSMNEEPIIKDNILEVSLEGRLVGDNYHYNVTNNITLPHIYNNTELLTNKSINSVLSQFIFNNALDFMYFYGIFSIEITNDTIGFDLNVGIISGVIVEITNNYTADQKVKIITNAYNSPILNLYDSDKIKVIMFENIQIFVYNKTEINGDVGTIPIDANSEIDIEADFSVKDDVIQLKITSIKMINFEVLKSLVGEINTDKVINNFNSLILIYLSSINKGIKNLIDKIPMPITIDNITLNELEVQTHTNYLQVDLSPILDTLSFFIRNSPNSVYWKVMNEKSLNKIFY